jgi:hypothetical protein
MTRYTVVWVQSAIDALADLWLQSADRNAIAQATHEIDHELAEDASTKGRDLSEGLRSLRVPPLKVIFAVNEDDRIVEVLVARIIDQTES